MASTDELTPEQQTAVGAFVAAMDHMGRAMAELDRVGLDAVTALRSIPGETEGSTMFDALPPSIRMLLG